MQDQGIERVSFDISTELNDRLNRWLPWGMKAIIMRVLVQDLVEQLETRGEVVLTEYLQKYNKVVQNLDKGDGNAAT